MLQGLFRQRSQRFRPAEVPVVAYTVSAEIAKVPEPAEVPVVATGTVSAEIAKVPEPAEVPAVAASDAAAEIAKVPEQSVGGENSSRSEHKDKGNAKQARVLQADSMGVGS